MPPQRESLPAVTAAGVVAILFALFGVVSCGFLEIFIWTMPAALKSNDSRSPFPPEMRTIASVIYFFFFAIAVGELIVGINVLRRRNWARIIILIWAGLMALFCLFGVVTIFFVFNLSNTALPNVKDVGPFLLFMKIFMLLIYGVPFAVGVWWLILFTRPRVAAAFQNPLAFAPAPVAMDPSGFPAPALPVQPPAPGKPSCPLPIAIIAGFDLAGAVWLVLAVFVPIPFTMPLFLFGVEVPHIPYKVFLAALGLCYVACVIGIFRLQRWGLDTLLVVKSAFLLSGIVTLFNPRFMQAMNDVMIQAAARNPAFNGGQFILPHSFMEAILGFSYAFGLALVIVMVVYRGRFLKAAAEAGH